MIGSSESSVTDTAKRKYPAAKEAVSLAAQATGEDTEISTAYVVEDPTAMAVRYASPRFRSVELARQQESLTAITSLIAGLTADLMMGEKPQGAKIPRTNCP